MSLARVAVAFLVAVVLFSDNASGVPRKRVMPWMCLERCGDDSAAIAAQLKALDDHRELISDVSFELFNLGPGGTLVTNNLTRVLPFLRKSGFATYPMISSYPYPPDFLEWMRFVFKNPDSFIDTCVQTAIKEGFTGYNVDWEPAQGSPTEQDARDYANFLTKFAEALHRVGKELTVDFAGWSAIWDYSSLNASKADRLCCMGTYASKFETFVAQLEKAINAITLEKLGVGLQTVNESEGRRPLTDAEWEERFQKIIEAGVHEIDIWSTPIPDNMWKFISRFVSS